MPELAMVDASPPTPPWDKIVLLPKQAEFIEALWTHDYLLYAGGYRAGKTITGCYAAILLSVLCPRNIGLIGRLTATDLKDTTQRTFDEMLPHNLIAKWRPSENHLWLTNGSEILFRHLEQPGGRKGLTLGWAYIDEITEVSHDILKLLISRLSIPMRLPPRAALLPSGPGYLATKRLTEGPSALKLLGTTNTDAPGHWVHRAWFGPPPPNDIGLPAARRFAISARSRDNIHVPDQTLDAMDASYDPRYHERYVQGKWVDIGKDSVYYNFDRTIHVKHCPIDPHLPLVHAWDFNVNPMATVVMQRAGNEVRVVDEIVIHTSSTPEVCDEFLRRYEAMLRTATARGLFIYGDATAHTRGRTTGKSDYGIIADKYRDIPRLKFCVPRGNPPEADRVNAVNARLRANDGTIGLYIDPRCLNLIADCEQVHYKTGARVIDAPTGPKIEKGEDPMRSHTSDSMGYYIISAFPIKKPGSSIRHYNIRL